MKHSAGNLARALPGLSQHHPDGIALAAPTTHPVALHDERWPRPIAGGSGWAHRWTLIAAPRPSTDRRSTAFLLAYSLANAGGTIGYLPLLTLLLPVMIDQIAGNARLNLLAVIAVVGAVMADEIPDAQKGIASGLLALAGPVASALSAMLVGLDMPSEAMRLAIILAAVAAFGLPLLLTPAQPVDIPAAPIVRSPLRRNLAIAWTARLLVQTASVVLSLYLFYYVQSTVSGIPADALPGRIGRLVALTSAAALPIAVLLGRLSDQIARRKPFLLGAAAFAAAGLILMALVRTWQVGAIGFGMYTIGAAVFLPLHAGYAMQLLPDPRHRGRDLGLVNLTNTVPSIIGPTLARLLVTPRDFSVLLLMLGGLMIAGGYSDDDGTRPTLDAHSRHLVDRIDMVVRHANST